MTTDSNTARERPILFSGAMVRAILAGQKTVTRRVVATSNQLDNSPRRKEVSGDGVTFYRGFPRDPENVRMCGMYAKCDAPAGEGHVSRRVLCPYGWVGDRLWVKETWQALKFYRDWETGIVEDISFAPKIPKSSDGGRWTACYAADDKWEANGEDRGFPWRPSIFMPRWASRITLEIASIRVERLHAITCADAEREGIDPNGLELYEPLIRGRFKALWDGINAGRGYGWDVNPWVWRVSYRRVEALALPAAGAGAGTTGGAA